MCKKSLHREGMCTGLQRRRDLNLQRFGMGWEGMWLVELFKSISSRANNIKKPSRFILGKHVPSGREC